MAGLQQKTVRPRLACEITSEGVIAARASDKVPRLEVFTSRRFNEGTVAPGLTIPNILHPEALRTALSGALNAVAGKSKDVIVVLPDVAIRMMLLDFESLPTKRDEIEPVLRFRLKKSFKNTKRHSAILDMNRVSSCRRHWQLLGWSMANVQRWY